MAKSKKILIYGLLSLFSLIFTLPVIRSGLSYAPGIGFWGSNGHDGVWHLALINHINSLFSVPMPTFSGELLKNYHPFFDIIIAYISLLTRIDSSFLLFQLFPLLSSFIIVFLAYFFAAKLFNSPKAGLLFSFFTVFSNSAGFIYTFLTQGSIGGESLFWAMQSPSSQLNPPYTLSILFLLLLLYLLLLHYQKPSNKYLLLSSLILVLLPVTKAYSALIGFSVFGLYALISLFRRQYLPLLLLFISLLISFYLYRIYNPSTQLLFIFQPFWFTNSLIESPDRFYLPKVANARYTLLSSGTIGPRLIAVYLFSVFAFYFGNFFTRLLGLFRLKLPYSFHFLLLPPLILSALIPLFFIQKGTPWNTVQFLYYSLFLANIFLVAFLIKLKSKVQKIVIILVVLFNLVPGMFSYYSYLSSTAPTYISPSEIEALTFLRTQPKGTVLTYPYDKYVKNTFGNNYVPIWAYESTSYVAAFSRHPTFVDDYMNLDNSGFNWAPRLAQSIDFFKYQDLNRDRGFLVNNQISYIYLLKHQSPDISLHISDLYIDQIFDNGYSRIYRVQR